jgi:hypothetical protein
MTDTAGIYRNELPIDTNFTTVNNNWIRSSGLSPQANFLWIYLLSHKVGYELRDGQILSETGFGRKGLRAARKELVDSGWLVLERIKNPDGSLGTYAYHLEVSRDPQGTVAVGTVEQGTVAEGPHLRKPLVKKTNDKKTNTKGSEPRIRRLPEDWYPSERLLEMFATKWPSLDRDYEIDQFVNYWLATGGAKADWDRAFQVWMAKNEKEAQTRRRPGARRLSNAEKAALLVADMEARVEKAPEVFEIEPEKVSFEWLGKDIEGE